MMKKLTTAIFLMLPAAVTVADIVHSDDVIINGGSICVGFDCVNGENFGSDTIRLKENNLRIHFDDTSSSGSFPSNDWRITINDQSNGGASFFAIDDATNNKTPFKVEANAPSNSLLVESTGDIGVGTANPALEMHIKDGDSPAIRLEQDNSSGFAAQAWDVAGNETNFFVRDVTNSSKIPFKIRPSAPTNSLYINTNGNIGLGTASPDAPLDVERTSNTIPILQLTNAGPSRLHMTNSTKSVSGNETDTWALNSNGTFRLTASGVSGSQLLLDTNGNMTILGSLTQGSDVNRKENFEPVDGQSVLDKLSSLPILEWNYKNDGPDIRHVGPMAQDFYQHFILGNDEKGIASLDADGIAFVGIQQLNKNLKEKEQTIKELNERVEKLERIIERLAANRQTDTVASYTPFQ